MNSNLLALIEKYDPIIQKYNIAMKEKEKEDNDGKDKNQIFEVPLHSLFEDSELPLSNDTNINKLKHHYSKNNRDFIIKNKFKFSSIDENEEINMESYEFNKLEDSSIYDNMSNQRPQTGARWNNLSKSISKADHDVFGDMTNGDQKLFDYRTDFMTKKSNFHEESTSHSNSTPHTNFISGSEKLRQHPDSYSRKSLRKLNEHPQSISISPSIPSRPSTALNAHKSRPVSVNSIDLCILSSWGNSKTGVLGITRLVGIDENMKDFQLPPPVIYLGCLIDGNKVIVPLEDESKEYDYNMSNSRNFNQGPYRCQQPHQGHIIFRFQFDNAAKLMKVR